MNCSLKLDLAQVVPQDKIDSIKIAGQDAMAIEFYGVVINNFGHGDGEDRPEPWPVLSPIYAVRAHGGDTSPTLILSETLIASIDQRLGNKDSASVFTECEYAETHQFGAYTHFGDGIAYVPPRPFFPIVGDEVTPYTEQKCIAAARKAIDSLL